MGLVNYFLYRKKSEADEYLYDLFRYCGKPLPNIELGEGLIEDASFTGKDFLDLFKALVKDSRFTLYSEKFVEKDDLEAIASIMSLTKRHLLAENGELWWNSYLEDHLSDSDYKDCYDYDTTLSFISMFEWYSKQPNVVMWAYW